MVIKMVLTVVTAIRMYMSIVYCTAISGGKNAIGVNGFGNDASVLDGSWDPSVELMLTLE